MTKPQKLIISVLAIIFFVFPLLWINSSTKLGCLGNIPCMGWQLFRGLFLWPFSDIWTDMGMGRIMTSYVLFGIGTILIYVIFKKGKLS